MFVSCTSNLLEQVCGFQKYIMFLQKWILNLQDLPQSQSPETVPICIAWQYFPHDNIVCIHLYDEYTKSIDSDVCHRLQSILLWNVRACLLTIKYQAVQFLPNINISVKFNYVFQPCNDTFQFGEIVRTSYDEYTALVKSGNVASKHVNGWKMRSKRQI